MSELGLLLFFLYIEVLVRLVGKLKTVSEGSKLRGFYVCFIQLYANFKK